MSAKLITNKLDFVVTDEWAEVGHGAYWIFKADREWCVRYVPNEERPDGPLAIVAYGEDEAGAEALIDWPMVGVAREIAGAHDHLMESGHSAESAAQLILEFSKEYLREKAVAAAALVEKEVDGHATH